MNITRSFCAILVSIALCANAYSDPILLASAFSDGITGFQSGSSPASQQPITGMAFFLTYGPDYLVRLGEQNIREPEQAGKVFFDAQTPGFTDLVAHLTNRKDEMLTQMAYLYGPNGLMGGGGGGSPESILLNGGPDLVGRDIEMISVDVTWMSFSQYTPEHPSFDVSYRVNWQFWGTGIPANTYFVPDTGSTLALLGGAFLALAALRRRFVA